MNRNQFLTAALQNPANEIIAEELFRLARFFTSVH